MHPSAGPDGTWHRLGVDRCLDDERSNGNVVAVEVRHRRRLSRLPEHRDERRQGRAVDQRLQPCGLLCGRRKHGLPGDEELRLVEVRPHVRRVESGRTCAHHSVDLLHTVASAVNAGYGAALRRECRQQHGPRTVHYHR